MYKSMCVGMHYVCTSVSYYIHVHLYVYVCLHVCACVLYYNIFFDSTVCGLSMMFGG